MASSRLIAGVEIYPRNEVEADMRTTDRALQSAEQRHKEYLKHQRAGTISECTTLDNIKTKSPYF